MRGCCGVFWGGCDVGDYVVDADGFALGKGPEGDLDLGHAVGVGVVFGVFAEFLQALSGLHLNCSSRGAYSKDDVLLRGNFLLSHPLS